MVSGARMPRSLRQRPRPQNVLRGDACTLDSSSLSSPASEPRCAGGEEAPAWLAHSFPVSYLGVLVGMEALWKAPLLTRLLL